MFQAQLLPLMLVLTLIVWAIVGELFRRCVCAILNGAILAAAIDYLLRWSTP